METGDWAGLTGFFIVFGFALRMGVDNIMRHRTLEMFLFFVGLLLAAGLVHARKIRCANAGGPTTDADLTSHESKLHQGLKTTLASQPLHQPFNESGS